LAFHIIAEVRHRKPAHTSEVNLPSIEMKTFIIDTNVLTYLDELAVDLEYVMSRGEFVYTRVQEGEIMDIPDDEIRDRRICMLRKICSRKVPAESDVWMDSLRWDDEGVWTEDTDVVAERVAKGSYARKKRHDAMILAAAKREGCTLVSNDEKMRLKARGEGVDSVSADEVFSFVKREQF